MDIDQDSENVTTVMTEVLNRLERVVEHFRENGKQDAANVIAKNTINTVNTFNEAVSEWDVRNMTLTHLRPRTLTTSSAGCESVSQNKGLPKSLPAPYATTSWAAVAAVAPAAGNKLIKFTPKDGVQTKVKEASPVPVMANTEALKRVIWIRGWPEHKSLGHITDKIGHGPIYSMAYSKKDGAVCVIFQLPYSAKSVVEDDQRYRLKNGFSRFGPECEVVEGLPFAEDDNIRRMGPPFNERRRLTFARSQLFVHGMNEEKFKNDIYAIIGEKNVELVWLFNTGNATVVFSAVPIARLVRDEFIKNARSPTSPYQGITISFSHDPCERPMSLISQMPNSPRGMRTATYGREIPLPASMTRGNGNRRSTLNDNEGWQTVSRRR